nr:dynamin family protein [uncultured Desulfobacter sp.]
MDTEQFLQETSTLRNDVISLSDKYIESAQTMSLREMDDAAIQSVERLKKNEFNILVAGETKRGKSSFINALLGNNYLPVDDSIATSQAFEIRHSKEEAYRLRFSDDSFREIGREELVTFGSQKKIDEMGGVLELDGKTLSAIEVDCPARFLPPNITLVDTPGMGAVYSFHTQITQAYVAFCDAVIFVLDSNRPVLEEEIIFLKEILRFTPHIFFIQTKIDIHKDTWEEVLKDNEKRLNEQIGDQLSTTPRVWPISNKHLLTAAQSEGEKRTNHYVKISRFDELKNELNRFLFFVSGIAKTSETLACLNVYGNEVFSVITGRYKTIQTGNRNSMADKIEELKEKQKALQEQWDQDGASLKKSDAGVKEMLSIARRAFEQEFGKAGNVYKNIQEELEAIKKIGKLKKYTENLFTHLSEKYMNVMLELNASIFKELETEYMNISIQLRKYAPYPEDFSGDFSKHFKKMLEKHLPVMGGGRPTTTWIKTIYKVTVKAMTTTVFQLPGKIQNFLLGFAEKENQLIKIRKEILSNALSILIDIHAQLKFVDFKSGKRKDAITMYFDDLSREWSTWIKKMIEGRTKELDEELKRLNKQMDMEGEALKKELEKASCDVATWKSFIADTDGLLSKVDELGSILNNGAAS